MIFIAPIKKFSHGHFYNRLDINFFYQMKQNQQGMVFAK